MCLYLYKSLSKFAIRSMSRTVICPQINYDSLRPTCKLRILVDQVAIWQLSIKVRRRGEKREVKVEGRRERGGNGKTTKRRENFTKGKENTWFPQQAQTQHEESIMGNKNTRY